MFFTQSPSFLDYQVRMQKARGRNNAASLFGVHQIPSDQQVRNLLDPVPPEHLAPLLMDTVDGLYRLGALQTHRALVGGFLLALDGTQYFASHAISCPSCSTRTLANGKTQYHHVAVQGAGDLPQRVGHLTHCHRRDCGRAGRRRPQPLEN